MSKIIELVQELQLATEFYTNGNPIMTDDEFDALEYKLRAIDPNNTYFNQVGATVRGKKVKLKVPMGSLDQVWTEQDIKRWVNGLGLASDAAFVVGAKYDGSSIQVIYNEFGDLSQAITRGDGIEGLDVTRHVKRCKRIPKKAWPNAIVRCECIIDKTSFANLNSSYKNPRNYAAGQLNRTTADQEFVDNVSFIAFDANLSMDKYQIIEFLFSHGFTIPGISVGGDPSKKVDDFINLITDYKEGYEFEIDGLVIEVDSAADRQRIGFDGLNPAYSRKFKINLEFMDVNVVGIHWAVSKHGYLKPRIEIEPVEMNGVTITFATGHNAKNVLHRAIGPGAVIRITRSGDVIPYVTEVISGSTLDMSEYMPDREKFGEYFWNETDVDLVVKENSSEMNILQMVDFFTAIDAPLLKEGNIRALDEAGFDTIESVIKATEGDLVTVLGENGYKVFAGLRNKLTDIEEWKFAGSTNFFGRGIGQRKIKKIFDKFLTLKNVAITEIMDIDGFDTVSAVKVFEGQKDYLDFVERVKDYVSFKKVLGQVSGPLNGLTFVFTGVRSKEAEAEIELKGGKVAGSFTSDVTHVVAKDPSAKSGKLDKARTKGVTIMSLDEMWSFINEAK